MNPLHPRIRWIWRLLGLLGAVFIAAVLAPLEIWVLRPAGILTSLPAGGLTAAILILGLAIGLGWPTLRYRAWRWRVEPDRVVIQRGVLWRTRSLVPRVRIQHVDTRSSPLQRWLGLNTLVIYTAGTRGADVSIPGLTAMEAERFRDELGRLDELEREP